MTTIGDVKGDTRSLDYSSYGTPKPKTLSAREPLNAGPNPKPSLNRMAFLVLDLLKEPHHPGPFAALLLRELRTVGIIGRGGSEEESRVWAEGQGTRVF